MIVVDTNVVAYLLIAGQHTQAARATLIRDPEWSAPLLWRSEFRHVLALYLRKRHLSLQQAVSLQETAESFLVGREQMVESSDVLALAHVSGRSAYDYEFVATACRLNVKLITSDRAILASFPDDTVALQIFGSEMVDDVS